jgi:hypothetical protein
MGIRAQGPETYASRNIVNVSRPEGRTVTLDIGQQ